MIAEIITTGTELLLGVIVDTNAPFIARQLRTIGMNLYYKTTVGDNRDRLATALRVALSRADVVIVTGGLGPTVDDITREAVSDVTGRPLQERPEIVEMVKEFFQRRGRAFNDNNLRQAQLPQGARMLPNPIGTAPGFITEDDETGGVIITMPGVPREMERMMTEQVIPYLRERMGDPLVIVTRTLHVAGVGESVIDAMFRHLMTSSNPTAGLAAHLGQVDIRLAARAATEEDARALIAPAETEIRSKIAPWIYGVDDETLGGVIARELRQHSMNLALFETNTGDALLGHFQGPDRDVLAGHFVDISAFSGCDACSDFTEVNALAIAQAMREMTGADCALVLLGSDDPQYGFWSETRGETWLAFIMPDATFTKKLGAAGSDDFTTNWLSTTALAYAYRRLQDY